ncbi:MAG TPA: extracellular solute-binding protein [Bacillaceae bacterium]|nr:extracellular solute-binding protein [Paenibacillus bovis]HLU20868.1 extracellular solute-binding protein [Bacillaceae bacterium]
MKKKFSIIILSLVFMLVLSACSKGTDTGSKDGGKKNDDKEDELQLTFGSDLEGEITLWVFAGEAEPALYKDGIIPEFNKDYPNVKVNLVGLEFGQMHDQLQTTLNAGSGAPDVALVEQGQFPRYVTGNLLEDLLQPPYNAGKYKDMVSEYNWERWKSVDGEELYGIPWDVTPGVFYYREDIYEQYGLPSDPEELGEFLKSPENVLDAARTFAANGIYMFEWRDSPAIQYGDAVGYFDSEYNWTRNDDKMAELLDFVKEGVQIGWAPQISILYDDAGKQLVNQGKVASFPIGSFGARELRAIFPEQEGKWRATSMPLGLNVGLGGSTFVIPSQSKNKEAAWALVEWMNIKEEAWKHFVEDSIQPAWKHITSLPWYQEHTNDYLGGQQDYKLYDSLDEDIPVRRLTPLDGQAWPIYIDRVAEAIDKNIDSKTVLNQIEEAAMRELGPEIEKLKAELDEN